MDDYIVKSVEKACFLMKIVESDIVFARSRTSNLDEPGEYCLH
jgi:hypothetical protein